MIDALTHAFGGLGVLRTFVSWVDDPRDDGSFEVAAAAGDDVDFVRFSAKMIEELVGPVEPVGPNTTCADLAGSDHPLLALIPPPDEPRDPHRDLSVVAVSDVPWPHNPWKCEFADRFEQLAGLYPAAPHVPPAVGAHWFLTLSEAELASCPYHAADWKRIAAVALDVVRSLQLQPDATQDAAPAIRNILGESDEAAWCESLFSDPTDCGPQASRVTNGQHRACAVRGSGVDAGELGMTEPVAGDPRRTAAAEVAAFWARHAARSGADGSVASF